MTYEKLAGNICVMGIKKFIIFYVLDFEQRFIDQFESCENYKGFLSDLHFEVKVVSLDNFVFSKGNFDF